MIMTVLNHVNNDSITCMCGGTMIHKVNTITRVIRGHEIRIHNAPYYECMSCGEKEFDLSAKIASISVAAYKKGLNEVFWGEDLLK